MTSSEGAGKQEGHQTAPRETLRLEPGEGCRERTVLRTFGGEKRIFRGIMPNWLIMFFGSTIVFYFYVHSFY